MQFLKLLLININYYIQKYPDINSAPGSDTVSRPESLEPVWPEATLPMLSNGKIC